MISYRDCIVFLLAKAHQRAQGAFKQRLQPLGLTTVQGLLLGSLLEEEGVSVGDVGRKLGLDTATLAGVLERMAASGWIRRETDPDDARVGRIFVTEKARLAAPPLGEAVEAANLDVLGDFSLEEKLLLKRMLRDVRE